MELRMVTGVRGCLAAKPRAEVSSGLASGSSGLDSSESARRLAGHGRNILVRMKGLSLASKFLANFCHLMAVLLWAGGAVALLARLTTFAIAFWTVVHADHATALAALLSHSGA